MTSTPYEEYYEQNKSVAKELPQKVEFMNIALWDLKKDDKGEIDILNSKMLNIPVKYLAVGILIFKIIKKKL